MRASANKVLSVLVPALLAVATLGCSHNTVDSGTQDLNAVFTPRPAGLGRYEQGSMFLNRLAVVPVHPGADQVFVTEKLLFRFDNFKMDLGSASAVAFSRIALAAGEYRVSRIEFTPPALQDDNVSENPGTCIESFDVLNRQSAPGVPAVFGFDDPDLTFTIQPGQTTVSLTVDVPGLIAGYESSFTCVPGPPPTLTAFDAANFRNVLLATISLE